MAWLHALQFLLGFFVLRCGGLFKGSYEADHARISAQERSDAASAAAVASAQETARQTAPRTTSRRRRSVLGLASDSNGDTLGLPGYTPTAKPTLGA